MNPSDLVLPGLPSGPRSVLYHFSEDPDIREFRPRRSRPLPGYPRGRNVVWAIDEHHAPMYFFPRDCPRIVLWALERSSTADVSRWLGGASSRMVAFVECDRLSEIESCRLFRYSLDPETFEDTGDHGTHVSTAAVRPLDVTPLGQLPGRLQEAGVGLRTVESLREVADAVDSTLHFSGIRLSRSRTWDESS